MFLRKDLVYVSGALDFKAAALRAHSRQRSLAGYSPWGRKEWTLLKLLSTCEHTCNSLKTLSPSTVIWGIRVSAYTFRGTQTFSPSHLVVPETDQQSASTCALPLQTESSGVPSWRSSG